MALGHVLMIQQCKTGQQKDIFNKGELDKMYQRKRKRVGVLLQVLIVTAQMTQKCKSGELQDSFHQG